MCIRDRTVTEGLWLKEIIESISVQTGYDYDSLVNTLISGTVSSPFLEVGGYTELNNWEGLLFPETYRFSVEADGAEIFQTMANQLELVMLNIKNSKKVPAWLNNEYELFIIASLVETEAFIDEEEAGKQLQNYEALLIMRERTKITENLINNLKKLKYVITSGMRNKAIDLEAAKKRKIIVTGTEINVNPTSELTWALILGLARNVKPEIDNMYQGYWQTTVGVELKGRILGLIGLGKVGSQVAKIAKAFGMEVIAWSENLNLNRCKELDVLPSNKEDLLPVSYTHLTLPTNREV